MVTGRTAIQVQGRTTPIEVNRFVIQKGLDRQVVLYLVPEPRSRRCE